MVWVRVMFRVGVKKSKKKLFYPPTQTLSVEKKFQHHKKSIFTYKSRFSYES